MALVPTIKKGAIPISKFVDFDKVAEYFSIGGVRIECNIIITDDGIENMTSVDRYFGY